jgi:SAM-dependent methyltransferase
LQGLGDSMPFPDESFSSAFSNSVLEHIPDLPPVLSEINRVLRRGASFVITTPSHLFTDYLGGGEFFDKLKLSGLAGRYRNFFNLISRHAHTDSPETWTERLAQAGFMIERWQYYFSREALHALEIGHVQGLPSAILHALTGHWIIAPWDNSLRPTERWVRPFYEESPGLDSGAYLLIVARKVSHQAIPSILPPPLHLKIAAGENTRHDQPFAPAS